MMSVIKLIEEHKYTYNISKAISLLSSVGSLSASDALVAMQQAVILIGVEGMSLGMVNDALTPEETLIYDRLLRANESRLIAATNDGYTKGNLI